MLEPVPLYYIATVDSDGLPLLELRRTKGSRKAKFQPNASNNERFTMGEFTYARKAMIDLARALIPELPHGPATLGLFRVWNNTLMVRLPIYNEVKPNVQRGCDPHQYVL